MEGALWAQDEALDTLPRPGGPFSRVNQGCVAEAGKRRATPCSASPGPLW